MPGFDQTGPAGQGPMTGRRAGRCRNDGTFTGRGPGRGFYRATENLEEVPAGWGSGRRMYGAGRMAQGSGRGNCAGMGRGRGMGCGAGRGRQHRNG